MVFLHDEKVFSLSKTVGAVPYSNISKLFSELFSYLVVAGLYDEATCFSQGGPIRGDITEDYFSFGLGGYSTRLGELIAKGLKDRILAIRRHPDVAEQELEMLNKINSLFNDQNKKFYSLPGREFTNVATRRQFEDDSKTIAHYCAIMFGQNEFPEVKQLPKLYLSIFGNIHLNKDELVELDSPKLIYGRKTTSGEIITSLYALISAQFKTFLKGPYPAGDALGYFLAGLTLHTEPLLVSPSISAPRYASALTVKGMLELESYIPTPAAQAAYKEFLYGSLVSARNGMTVLRASLLHSILDVMMEKVDTTTKGHLFSDSSYFRKLFDIDTLTVPTLKTPTILKYALEALDAANEDQNEDPPANEDNEDENKSPDDTQEDMSEKDPVEDPETDSGGYDPSTPPPALPAGSPSMEKDTIGLISFDKTGEGIDEDLYRRTVVALNDRIQKDDDVSISAEVKDALNYWVNGYLYRTAITATKNQITSLGLQKYLKNV